MLKWPEQNIIFSVTSKRKFIMTVTFFAILLQFIMTVMFFCKLFIAGTLIFWATLSNQNIQILRSSDSINPNLGGGSGGNFTKRGPLS